MDWIIFDHMTSVFSRQTPSRAGFLGVLGKPSPHWPFLQMGSTWSLERWVCGAALRLHVGLMVRMKKVQVVLNWFLLCMFTCVSGPAPLCTSMSGHAPLFSFVSGPTSPCSSTPPERSHAGGAGLGRFGAPAGQPVAGAQIRRGLRGVFPEWEVHRQCGIPARHDGERVELEGLGGPCCLFRALAWDAHPVLWSVSQKNILVAANKVSSKVSAVSFSDDSSYFVTAGNRHVKFWYLDHAKTSKVVPLAPPSSGASRAPVLTARSHWLLRAGELHRASAGPFGASGRTQE